jgi:hypothetical protein
MLETMMELKTKELRPEILVYSEEIMTYLPAMVTELVGIPVVKVEPKLVLGRVHVFNATPHKQFDPYLLWVRGLNLQNYYDIWGKWVTNQYAHTDMDALISKLVEPVIKEIMEQALILSLEEQKYLYIQLLQWKLDIKRSR